MKNEIVDALGRVVGRLSRAKHLKKGELIFECGETSQIVCAVLKKLGLDPEQRAFVSFEHEQENAIPNYPVRKASKKSAAAGRAGYEDASRKKGKK